MINLHWASTTARSGQILITVQLEAVAFVIMGTART